MATRKKPIGNEWVEFEKKWKQFDHEYKLYLCADYGVSYDTAKHWISEGDTTTSSVRRGQKLAEEVVDLDIGQSAVNLDFVSFDIETSGFAADWSILMTAVVKPYGQVPIVFRADEYPEWTAQRSNDLSIVQAVAEELRKHAIIVTHYGSKFDIRFMRLKMVHHRLEPLPLMFGIDTWRIARSNFKMQSNRLEALSRYLELGAKDKPEGTPWVEAAYDGSREAMDKIVEHNIKDCEILERLACLSFPYLKSIPKL